MARNLTVRLDDELAADTEALARTEGKSLNETVKQVLRDATERRRKDPAFKAKIKRTIEQDRELLQRLAGAPALTPTCTAGPQARTG
jgi:predicted transcriptional regulator